MHTLTTTSLLSRLSLSDCLCTVEPVALLIITSLFCSYGSFLVLICSVVCAGPPPQGLERDVCTRCITVYAKLSTQLSGAGVILGREQKRAGDRKGVGHKRLSAAHAAFKRRLSKDNLKPQVQSYREPLVLRSTNHQ